MDSGPGCLKVPEMTASHATAVAHRHDINSAGKRNHRVSGLVQRLS